MEQQQQQQNQMIQELAALEKYEGPEKISCKDLTREEGYPILAMKRVTTKYGQSIAADITLPGGKTAITFLPSRFSENMTNAQIEMFNKGGFKIRCTGMTGQSINVTFFM